MAQNGTPDIYRTGSDGDQEAVPETGSGVTVAQYYQRRERILRLRSLVLFGIVILFALLILVLVSWQLREPAWRAEPPPRPAASERGGATLLDFGAAIKPEPAEDALVPPTVPPTGMMEAGAPLDAVWIKQAAYHLAEAEKAFREDSFARALEHYDHALRIYPGLRGVEGFRGLLLLRLDDPARAAEAFERALAEENAPAGVANNLGLCLLMLGREEEAHRYFERAREINPAYSLAHVNQAIMFLNQNRLEPAAASLQAYLEIRPDDLHVAQTYVQVLIDLERWPEAAAWLETLRRYAPSSAAVFFRLAQVLGRMGRIDQALQALTQGALLTDPRRALSWMSRPEFDVLRGHPQFARLVQDLTLQE